MNKKDEIKRKVYKEAGLSKNIFFHKCQSSTKVLCNVPTNSSTKHCAVATIFHPAKIKHGQSLQELGNNCILFDILKQIVCTDYFKIMTTCNQDLSELMSILTLRSHGHHLSLFFAPQNFLDRSYSQGDSALLWSNLLSKKM